MYGELKIVKANTLIQVYLSNSKSNQLVLSKINHSLLRRYIRLMMGILWWYDGKCNKKNTTAVVTLSVNQF